MLCANTARGLQRKVRVQPGSHLGLAHEGRMLRLAYVLYSHGGYAWSCAAGLEKRGPHITAFRGTAHQSRQCQRVQSSAQTEHDLLTQQQGSAPSAAEPVEDGGPLGRILSSGEHLRCRSSVRVLELAGPTLARSCIFTACSVVCCTCCGLQVGSLRSVARRGSWTSCRGQRQQKAAA